MHFDHLIPRVERHACQRISLQVENLKMPAISTVNIHNGFFRNAELEHLKQLNTDSHEIWKCTVLIKCIFDILASRETHFLCSFTSLLYFHLRFNYLPRSHLRMCRLPFTIHQALHVGGTNPFIQKKKKWTSHSDRRRVCALDKAKDASCTQNTNVLALRFAVWRMDPHHPSVETFNYVSRAKKELIFPPIKS